MIWLRRLFLSCVILITLVILTLFIAVSRVGSPMLVQYAIDNVDDLAVESIEGGLSSTLTLNNLLFENTQVEVTVGRTSIDIDWQCFVQFALCFESIEIEDTSVLQKVNPSPPETDEAPDNLIRLPFLIAIDQLSVDNTKIALSDGTRLTLDSLSTEFRAYQRIRVLQPILSELSIELPPASGSTEKVSERSDIVLPDVYVPVDMVLQDLTLNSASLKQAETVHAISRMSLNTVVKESDVTINQFVLEHELGSINLQGKVELANDYPLDVTSSFDFAKEDLPPASGQIHLQGSLAALVVDSTVNAPIASTAQLNIEPLKAQLPLDAKIEWTDFSNLELGLSSTFSIKAGTLQLSGSMEDYLASLSTEVSLPDVPTPIGLQVDGLVNTQRALLNNLVVETLNGSIAHSGIVHLQPVLNWQTTTTLSNLNLGLLAQDLPSELEGEIVSEGQFSQGTINTKVPTFALNGNLQGYPLTVSGSGAYAGVAGVVVSTLDVAHIDNRIQGFVRLLLENRVDADLIVSIKDLSDSLQSLSGTLRGNIQIMGDVDNPDVLVDLSGNDIKWLEGEDPIVIASNLGLNVDGSLEQSAMRLQWQHPAADLLSVFTFDRQQPTWMFEPQAIDLELAHVTYQLAQAGRVLFVPETGAVSSEPICIASTPTNSLCVHELSHYAEQLVVEADIVDISVSDINALLKNSLTLSSQDALLNGTVNISKPVDSSLSMQSEMRISDAIWQVGKDTDRLRFSTEPIVITSALVDDQLETQFAIAGPEIGTVNGQALVTLDATPIELNAQFTARNFDVAPFAYVSPDINRLQGVIDADFTIDGQLPTPSLSGSLRVTNGIIDVKQAPAILEEWQLQANFSGQEARFNSEFILGEGNANAEGTINWQDGVAVTGSILGEALTVKHQDIEIALSPDIEMQLSPTGIQVAGQIVIPKAKIKVDELPANAISPSDDVHMRGEPPPTSLMDTADIDVQVIIDPERLSNVSLQAFGLEANLTGNLHLVSQPTMSGFGELSIENGEYRAYGQEMIIRTGELQFNGPIGQPLIYVEAIRDPDLTEDGVIAGIRIDGLANQPSVELFSEPTLNQSETLSYLLSGKGDISGSESDNGQYTALLYGLGVSSSGALTNSVGDALGIDDLRLQAKGSGEDMQVTVSGKLSDDLTVEYGVGVFDSKPEVTLRYQLMPRLYLEAVKSLYESLILYYRFSVGTVTPEDIEEQQVTH